MVETELGDDIETSDGNALDTDMILDNNNDKKDKLSSSRPQPVTQRNNVTTR